MLRHGYLDLLQREEAASLAHVARSDAEKLQNDDETLQKEDWYLSHVCTVNTAIADGWFAWLSAQTN